MNQGGRHAARRPDCRRDRPHHRPLPRTRGTYLDRMRKLAEDGPRRAHLTCGNQAHAYAAMGEDKDALVAARAPNLGIVTAYNDMLSAHQPFKDYPDRIKAAARRGRRHGAGRGRRARDVRRRDPRPGRDGIVAVFARRDRAGGRRGAQPQHLRRGALSRRLRQDRAGPRDRGGHLRLPARASSCPPVRWSRGLPNDEKAKVRQQFAAGEVGRDTLMEAEMASYHGPGTCTFYGTANSNQMLMEFMGLHLPGASFVNPGTPLRDALTDGRHRTRRRDHRARQRLHAGLRYPRREGLRERHRRARWPRAAPPTS